MNTSNPSQPMKRRLLSLAALWPWVTGCAASGVVPGEAVDPQRRFKGIGIVLVVDAVPGAEMRGVVISDDRGQTIDASSLVARRNRGIMALGGVHVPVTVRVTWRE